jgi:tryptophan-rich sensory protein
MKLVSLVVFLGTSLLAGVIGALFTGSSVKTWFPELIKPAWNPPAALFGPVWTVLYILIGISAWKVWLTGHFWGVPATIFAIQLALNIGWSWLFFGQRRPDLALIEIVLLWLSILAMVIVFSKQDRNAGWLLLPYLLWVSFASVLNFSIWTLNRK